MPRPQRAALGGYCYHVLNRGNGRQKVFRKPADYVAFRECMADASLARPVRLVAYCLMPNHFHLVLWPERDGDLSTWMQKLTTAHVRRYHAHHKTSGHLWQGRYKSFPIQEDDHLRTVIRYVERNPLRAGLTKSARDWEWSSLPGRTLDEPPLPLATSPVPLPDDWPDRVDERQTEAELKTLRECLARNRPYGTDRWTKTTAGKLKQDQSLRPRGRPRKEDIEKGA